MAVFNWRLEIVKIGGERLQVYSWMIECWNISILSSFIYIYIFFFKVKRVEIRGRLTSEWSNKKDKSILESYVEKSTRNLWRVRLITLNTLYASHVTRRHVNIKADDIADIQAQFNQNCNHVTSTPSSTTRLKCNGNWSFSEENEPYLCIFEENWAFCVFAWFRTISCKRAHILTIPFSRTEDGNKMILLPLVPGFSATAIRSW